MKHHEIRVKRAVLVKPLIHKKQLFIYLHVQQNC